MMRHTVSFVRYCIAAANAERPGVAGMLAVMFVGVCGLVVIVGMAALCAL